MNNKNQFMRVALILVCAVFFTIRPAAAGDNGAWTLIESAGDVHINKPGIQPIALTTGDEVGPGQRIVTKGDGRAVLKRGKNTIVVSPNSVLEVPAGQQGNLMTRVRHLVGTLLFDVEKRAEQHFEVLTPDVAVVVKGTTFTTSVGNQGAVVHVISGLVQVADIKTGQSVFVRPGQTAVSPQGGGKVSIGTNPAATPGTEKSTGPGQNADGDQASNGNGQGNAKGRGVKIASVITGNNQSIGQASKGLLRKDGALVQGKGVGRGNGQGKAFGKGKKGAPAAITQTVSSIANGNSKSVPPGQAKKGATDWVPPGQAKAKTNNGKAKGKNK